MRKDQVKLSGLRPFPPVIFGPTFDTHMTQGDKSGASHSGLHLIDNFRNGATNALPGVKLTAADLRPGNRLNGRFTAPDREATIEILDVDPRARTFRAAVNIYGTAKKSSFFPIGTTLANAKNYIDSAWSDHCTYGSTTWGGGDVDIYRQMRTAFGLNWVGQTTINSQQVWVGAALAGPLVTAFPAVNNKFVTGG